MPMLTLTVAASFTRSLSGSPLRGSFARQGLRPDRAIGSLTRSSFMMRPVTFPSWTYRLPYWSQDEPCVPLKIPSIHSSCFTL